MLVGEGVALLRIEELHPFPAEALARRRLGAQYRRRQEEPENMGIWGWIERRLGRVLPDAGGRSPRPAQAGSPSSTGGFHDPRGRARQRIVAKASAG